MASVSLPALSGIRPGRRAREAIADLISMYLGKKISTGLALGLHQSGFGRFVARLLHPIDRVSPNRSDVDVRFLASRGRGRARLLAGMVRSNEPWLLLPGLSGALAGALAFVVFMMQSSIIWQMSDHLGAVRLALWTVLSVLMLVVWLIVAHGLWERTPRRGDPEETVFYNLSTVFTLFISVLCMYAVVFVVVTGTVFLFLPATLLEQEIGHAVDAGTYLRLAWLTSSAVMVAGAIGSTFESDSDVSQAAYGYREQRRREERDRRRNEERNQRGGAV